MTKWERIASEVAAMGADHIVVVGSINMDLVARTERMPSGGETLLGSSFHTVPGGKGANQSVAIARAGGRAKFVGRVGDDLFGRQLLDNLRNSGVDTSAVRISDETATGVAVILVDDRGENSIVVIPGANDDVSQADIEAARAIVETAQAILVQLEIPLTTVESVILMAHKAGVPVILDPGPARPLPRALLAMVDIITPNEHEAQILTGVELRSVDDAKRIARMLLEWGVPKVLVKLGGEGVIVATAEAIAHIPAHKVTVVDTTAAGDSFAGGLAVALVEGHSLWDAVCFANAVGALSVTRLGAQSAIPTRREVDEFLRSRGSFCG